MRAARWCLLLISLLVLAWVLLSGQGAQAPKYPPLPSKTTRGVHP